MIAELKRLIAQGCGAIAFAWDSFWWFDYYETLRNYLVANYPRIRTSAHLIAFRLDRPAADHPERERSLAGSARRAEQISR